MKKPTVFRINGIALQFFFAEDQPVKVLDVTRRAYRAEEDAGGALLRWARLVEIQANGLDWDDHHANKYTGTLPGGLLRYQSHRKTKTALGPKLEITQVGGGIEAVSHLQFLGRLPAWRSWTTIKNVGEKAQLIEYVSTFALAGVSREGTQFWPRKSRLHMADNTWCGECQWRSGELRDFGLTPVYTQKEGSGFGLNRLSFSSMGTWSTSERLPMGALENIETGQTYFWQIEHNGSWQWEISDFGKELYLRLSGPTFRESMWSKNLAPGAIFETVPATFGRVAGGIQEALRVLTQSRRLIRRPHPDLKEMPVIFNDYMNCLFGDPTTEKLKPVIAAAAKVGCEHFVIDAGWYADAGRSWWDTVGEWQPSKSRFPGGLKAVTDLIRESGMVPGLWLEVEVVGINSPLAPKMPDSWFFQRDGRRVIDHGRYQLDFRNPEVRAHADEIVERMIRDFGIGYLKMDYNINAGPGTDFQADSMGDGLLEHNRAYLEWVKEVFRRHPTLVIENCSSGGQRLDYAQLAVHSIQSTSDQTDYLLNAMIAAASATACTPEQAAVWSYPLKDEDEHVTLNMVNALLMRIHQSGHLHEMSEPRLGLVAEGISLYKKIRRDIAKGLPFWPLGLPHMFDGWAAFGLDCGSRSYLAVWRLDGKNRTQKIVLQQWAGKSAKAKVIYPVRNPVGVKWAGRTGTLEVTLPKNNMARIIEIG